MYNIDSLFCITFQKMFEGHKSLLWDHHWYLSFELLVTSAQGSRPGSPPLPRLHALNALLPM